VGLTPNRSTRKKHTLKQLWHYWAKALGEKASTNDAEADIVALFRTLIIVLACVANVTLIVNAVHHW
jgi:hypothetical protein